jgi:undecaprenyl diphosphate synthase
MKFQELRQKIVDDAIRGRLAEVDILAHPELIFSYLDTKGQPLPDLVVRTGSLEEEIPHTSGFMPLQTTYSGWKFISTFFPDLTPGSLLTEIQKFLVYERRLGK